MKAPFPWNPGRCEHCGRKVKYRKRVRLVCDFPRGDETPTSLFWICTKCNRELSEE